MFHLPTIHYLSFHHSPRGKTSSRVNGQIETYDEEDLDVCVETVLWQKGYLEKGNSPLPIAKWMHVSKVQGCRLATISWLALKSTIWNENKFFPYTSSGLFNDRMVCFAYEQFFPSFFFRLLFLFVDTFTMDQEIDTLCNWICHEMWKGITEAYFKFCSIKLCSAYNWCTEWHSVWQWNM